MNGEMYMNRHFVYIASATKNVVKAVVTFSARTNDYYTEMLFALVKLFRLMAEFRFVKTAK